MPAQSPEQLDISMRWRTNATPSHNMSLVQRRRALRDLHAPLYTLYVATR